MQGSWETQDILCPDEYQEILDATDPELLKNMMDYPPIYQSLPVADSTFLSHGYLAATGPLPSRDDFPGAFDFSVLLGGDKTSKSKWTYSAPLNKLYIVHDKVIPMQFKWDPLEPNLLVRALPVYTDAQDMKHPVLRCLLHSNSQDPSNEGFDFPNHVIRSDNPGASYNENVDSKRTSVVVPLGELQPGTGTVTVTYKFMCKTTCVTGMMRRPITVLFTLERANGDVVGRQKLNVKICSCPRRDMEKDELSVKEGSKKRQIAICGKFGVKKIKLDEEEAEHEDGEPFNLSFDFEDIDTYKKVLDFNHGAVTSLLRLRTKSSPSYAELTKYLNYIECQMKEINYSGQPSNMQ